MNRHDEQVLVCFQDVKIHVCLLGNNVKQPEKEATTKFLLFRNVKQEKNKTDTCKFTCNEICKHKLNIH